MHYNNTQPFRMSNIMCVSECVGNSWFLCQNRTLNVLEVEFYLSTRFWKAKPPFLRFNQVKVHSTGKRRMRRRRTEDRERKLFFMHNQSEHASLCWSCKEREEKTFLPFKIMSCAQKMLLCLALRWKVQFWTRTSIYFALRFLLLETICQNWMRAKFSRLLIDT